MVNSRVRKVTKVHSNTKMCDIASTPGYSRQECNRPVQIVHDDDNSDQEVSDDDYESDTDDDEHNLERQEQRASRGGVEEEKNQINLLSVCIFVALSLFLKAGASSNGGRQISFDNFHNLHSQSYN